MSLGGVVGRDQIRMGAVHARAAPRCGRGGGQVGWVGWIIGLSRCGG